MVSTYTAPLLARLDDRLRPWLVRMPPRVAVRLYSRGRQRFLQWLVAAPPTPYAPAASLSRTLWGLRFRAPLGNAAGMFKNGEGYELCAAQGAGWYLAGTSTELSRPGNRRHGIAQPFAPYPASGAASNWLGLPNDGHATVAARLARLERVDGCPIGASVSATTDIEEEATRLDALIEGLERYRDAGVDFLELNESCPNTEELPQVEDSEDVLDADLRRRLDTLAERFLRHRGTPLPVIVKFSTDTDPRQVPALLDLLLDLGFDGVNFGNTSTDYDALRPALANPAEQRLLDYFSSHFGGGVSGRPLREKSLALVRAARAHLDRRKPERGNSEREFHIVRTGGVEEAEDVRASEAAGASLSQWYTGYFDAFGRRGHEVYRQLFTELLSLTSSP